MSVNLYNNNKFKFILLIVASIVLIFTLAGCSEEQKKAMKKKLRAEMDENANENNAEEKDSQQKPESEEEVSPYQDAKEKLVELGEQIKAKEEELKEVKGGFKNTREAPSDVSLNMTSNMDKRKELRQKTLVLNKEINNLKRKYRIMKSKLKKMKSGKKRKKK